MHMATANNIKTKFIKAVELTLVNIKFVVQPKPSFIVQFEVADSKSANYSFL